MRAARLLQMLYHHARGRLSVALFHSTFKCVKILTLFNPVYYNIAFYKFQELIIKLSPFQKISNIYNFIAQNVKKL